MQKTSFVLDEKTKQAIADRSQYVLERSAMGLNTPITRLELDDLRDEFRGRQFHVTTGAHPNRKQRRSRAPRTFNNRKLTLGRVTTRVASPTNGYLIEPTKQKTGVNLFRIFGKRAFAIKTKIRKRLRFLQTNQIAN